jgi:hypothetical protein
MDLDGGVIHNEGRLKGWALKSRLFKALKWERAKRVLFGPKKVEISGPTLQKSREMDFPPSKSVRPASYKQQVHW